MSMSPEGYHPDAPPAMHKDLSRVAVLHELPPADSPHSLPSSENEYVYLPEEDQPESPGGLHLQRATDQDSPESVLRPTPDALEKQRALAAIRLALVTEVSDHSDTTGTNALRPDWATTAQRLYASAKEQGNEATRDEQLVSAVIASQLSSDPQGRIDLLRRVYAEGQQALVRTACERSKIMLVHDVVEHGYDTDGDGASRGETVYLLPIQKMGDAFNAPAEQMTAYLDVIESKGNDNDSTLNPQRVRRNLLVSMQTEGHDYSAGQPQAERASRNDERVRGLIVDRHKVERFALQEFFLRDQEAALLGHGDVADTPLAHKLTELHQQGSTVIDPGDLYGQDEYDVLTADVERAIADLSQPVIAEYRLDDPDTASYDNLTKRQAASLRFRDITIATSGDIKAAFFIDFNQAAKELGNTNLAFYNFEAGRNIWDIAETGSTLPIATVAILQNAVEAARSVSPAPQAQELHALVQANRRALAAAAAKNITADSPQAAFRIRSGAKAKIVRDQQTGQLAYEGLLVPPGKSDFDVLAAVTLGCPVLRIEHDVEAPKADDIEKLASGNGRYFDHMSAVVIHEAYQRGMLSPYWVAANEPNPWL